MTAIIVLSTWLITISAKNDSIAYFFLKKFQSLELRNKVKIISIRHLDGFNLQFSECLNEFYRDTIGVRTYELEDKKKINVIAVSEYVFKDTAAAHKAFDLSYSYVESVRKSRRMDFSQLCYKMPAPQAYYASREGSHVYIYTTVYNFFYHSKEDSVDTLMQTDKLILLDDLYREMSLSR